MPSPRRSFMIFSEEARGAGSLRLDPCSWSARVSSSAATLARAEPRTRPPAPPGGRWSPWSLVLQSDLGGQPPPPQSRSLSARSSVSREPTGPRYPANRLGRASLLRGNAERCSARCRACGLTGSQRVSELADRADTLARLTVEELKTTRRWVGPSKRRISRVGAGARTERARIRLPRADLAAVP